MMLPTALVKGYTKMNIKKKVASLLELNLISPNHLSLKAPGTHVFMIHIFVRFSFPKVLHTTPNKTIQVSERYEDKGLYGMSRAATLRKTHQYSIS